MDDNALYDSFFEDSLDAAVIVGDDGRVRRMNRAAREFRALDLTALAWDGPPGKDLSAFREGLKVHARAILELELRDDEGRDRHVELQGRRVGGSFVVIARDTTEHHRVNDELFQLRRAQSPGYLAAGLAHDFNNFLTVILCSSAALANEVGNHGALMEIVHEIQLAAGRATTIVRQLLSPEPRKPRPRQPVNVNEVVADVHPLLERVAGSKVEVSLALGADVGETALDRDAFERALMNLAVNARDAMPDGGRLTIGTHRVKLGEDEPTAPNGEYVAIAVSDTGVGMSREVRDRIFDRFFTTKGASRGTGLGLSTVQRFVIESGGCISVHSYPGQGTTFLIYLPRADCGARSVRGDEPEARTSWCGPGALLGCP